MGTFDELCEELSYLKHEEVDDHSKDVRNSKRLTRNSIAEVKNTCLPNLIRL